MKEKTFFKKNEEMIEYLKKENILKSKRLEDALRKVPRHYFVPKKFLEKAYLNETLPLSLKEESFDPYGGWLSEPRVIVQVLEEMEIKENEKVLDVGTGSGWQACLLAYLVGKKGKVVTIEIDRELYEFSKSNISKFNFKNIELVLGDGSYGYKKYSPYDKIIVSAAASKIPKPLIDQLKVGGRLSIPIGTMTVQEIVIYDKISKNKSKKRSIGWFLFTPLKGKFGWKIY